MFGKKSGKPADKKKSVKLTGKVSAKLANWTLEYDFGGEKPKPTKRKPTRRKARK